MRRVTVTFDVDENTEDAAVEIVRTLLTAAFNYAPDDAACAASYMIREVE